MIAGYESYLRFILVEFMKMPPVEHRVAMYVAVYIDMDRSYTDYKGINYLVNKYR